MTRLYTWDVLDRATGHVIGDHARTWSATTAEQAARFYSDRIFFNRETGEVVYA